MRFRTVRRGVQGTVLALAATVTACGGCDTPTGSCVGLEVGLVRVLVVDQDGAPVPNVQACGANVCSITQDDGVTVLPVGAGQKRIRIEPPEGYVYLGDPLGQLVFIPNGETLELEFELVRQ